VSFPPTSFFFPPSGPVSALSGDLSRVSAHSRALQAAAAPPEMDAQIRADVSLLVGPKKCGKSRLLLQLSYRLAAEAIDPAAAVAAAESSAAAVAAAPAAGSSSDGQAAPVAPAAAEALVPPVAAALVGDPFQPVLLLLPKSRNTAASGGVRGRGGPPPLVGLFGPHLNAAVLQKIKIKWYDNEEHLLSLLCHLHLLSASCSSNVSGVPPRFVGVLYDARLSSEAAHLAVVMARLSEAVVAINNSSEQAGSFAKCQALFVMSHVPSVGRLKTLLPRSVRCVFEVTDSADHSGFLLHTRPMISPLHASPAVVSQLLTPLSSLSLSDKLLPTHKDVQLILPRMPALPVLKYAIQEAELTVTAILV